MTHDEHQSCGDTLPTHYDAVLFDLDGVVTKTASVHAAAWKRSFDAFLKRRTTDPGQAFVPFDIEADYRRYVGGSSLNCYRNSSASTCTSAIAVIRSSWRLRVMRSPYVDMTTTLCRSSWDATTRCMNSPAAARVFSSSAERRCQPSCPATVGTAPLPTPAPGQRIGSSSPRKAVTHLSHSIVQQTLYRACGGAAPGSEPRHGFQDFQRTRGAQGRVPMIIDGRL